MQSAGFGDQGEKQPFPRRAHSSRRMVRFLVLFGVSVFLGSLLLRMPWFDHSVVLPYTSFITATAGFPLKALGIEVTASGTTLSHPNFSVNIRKGCDGLEATLLLVCATVAYPFGSSRRRWWALVSGCVLIFVLNMVRVIGLFLLGVKGFMGAFDFVHTYVAQFTVVIAVMVLWFFWISGDQPPGRDGTGKGIQAPQRVGPHAG